MNKFIYVPGHLLYDEVGALVQSLAIRLGIALFILVALVIALVVVIRRKSEKEGK